MMARARPMNSHRAGSFALLAGGLLLVFAGLSAALGFSVAGTIASAAVMLALLYAGGVWLGAASRVDATVLLFTRSLTIASGPFRGRPVGELFPTPFRTSIEAGCRNALEGRATRVSCGPGKALAASPVRSAEGAIVYGLLLSGAAAEAMVTDFTPVA